MINPNKEYKAKGIITALAGSYGDYQVTLTNGSIIEGWTLPKRFNKGDMVCITGQFYITADRYLIKYIRKAPRK